MALHDLHGVVISLSDACNDIRGDWGHWAAIRKFEIEKVGSRVTLREL